MTTIAVMQPYFVPYAGYFRLFAAADLVVAFDCVQFPRRGWVHRNRFAGDGGSNDWLTLPMRKSERDTRIADLRFTPDAAERVAHSVGRFPLLARARANGTTPIELVLNVGLESVADYLCAQLRDITAMLGISRPIVRSSTLDIPGDIHAQERVIAVAEALGATRYVNLSGGRALYDRAAFARRGIELHFLTPFDGPADSILTRLLTQPAAEIATEIRRATILVR